MKRKSQRNITARCYLDIYAFEYLSNLPNTILKDVLITDQLAA